MIKPLVIALLIQTDRQQAESEGHCMILNQSKTEDETNKMIGSYTNKTRFIASGKEYKLYPCRLTVSKQTVETKVHIFALFVNNHERFIRSDIQ